jgi:hypothetical protein
MQRSSLSVVINPLYRATRRITNLVFEATNSTLPNSLLSAAW